MSRHLKARLDKLADHIVPTAPVTWCAHHGDACDMGARPLSELYRMIIEAKRRQGIDCPPLDEHQVATREQQAVMRASGDQALAEAKARVAAEEAELIAGEMS
ncbi:hypothetical protein [Streptomyces clavifer]|uniref:hypothetical protein n=1 Tax=Streptomyces clavifer TaxID=68188 RepID=UPI00382C9991